MPPSVRTPAPVWVHVLSRLIVDLVDLRVSPCPLPPALPSPQASPNDRFVALELLKNANIAAGFVLPGCQVRPERGGVADQRGVHSALPTLPALPPRKSRGRAAAAAAAAASAAGGRGARGGWAPGLAQHRAPSVPHGGAPATCPRPYRPVLGRSCTPGHTFGVFPAPHPLPLCGYHPSPPAAQDTGTATVVGKRGQYVWTDGRDEEALSRGVFRAYTQTNLRYSQVRRGWPCWMGVGPDGRLRLG